MIRKPKTDEMEKPKVRSSRADLMTTVPDSSDDVGNGAINARDYVNSLARGLEVLRAFNRTGHKMTLSEVAAETGNTRAGVRRILLTLVRDGYAVMDGRLFDLTPLVLELGASVLSSKGLWDIARPFIQYLSEDIEESASAAILDNYEVVYVTGSQYHRVISIGITIGKRFPAHTTATGRVLISGLPDDQREEVIRTIPLTGFTEFTTTDRGAFRAAIEQVREQGWSLVNQEQEHGLLAVGAPIIGSTGEMVGAVNVAVPTLRQTPEGMVKDILPRLQETVEGISSAVRLEPLSSSG